MTKKNNKGFSLIEIVIAIAVLTLLLSPIIVQLVQSIRVNAQAKEKQYAIENAEYVLEYFQKTALDEIGNDGVVTVNSQDENASALCEVHDATGVVLAPSGVRYTVTDFYLNSMKLGKDQNEYSRVVSVDDLSNKLLEAGFSIKYSFTDIESESLLNQGYTFTNEGACVKYNDKNHIVDIICEADSSLSGYIDPNTVNLSYIQDLDSSKVAIIQGVASNPDKMATAEFYALKMSHLKQVSYSSWEQAMNRDDGDSIFSASGFRDTTNKYTRISITSGSDAKGTYYDVSCDIYYSDVYNIPMAPDTGFTNVATESTIMTNRGSSVDVIDVLQYNVFSQRFYLDEAPDIYFIYEPFVETSTTQVATYAANDYIAVYNDQASMDAKIYLIKPDDSQLTVKQNTYGVDMSNYNPNVFWTNIDSASWKPVTIHVRQIAYSDPALYAEPLKIYTNLTIEEGATNLDKAQTFAFNAHDNHSIYSSFLPAGTYIEKYPGYSQNPSSTSRSDFVLPIEADTRYDQRLLSVTVRLFRTDASGDVVSGSETTFTGAKGAN